MWFHQKDGFEYINELSKDHTPFLFIISYDKTKLFVQTLNNLDDDIFYKLEDWRNYPVKKRTKDYTFSNSPIEFHSTKKL